MKLEDKELELKKCLEQVKKTTNLLYSKRLSELTDNNVYFKPENLQTTGSFKIRGSFYKISKMLKEREVKGLICASAGNHGQGVAYAGREYNLPTIVVLPKITPYLKINLIKGYGAEAVLYGDTYDEACDYAQKLNEEKGYEFIHAFNDEDVSYGQGSVALEILEEFPDVDVILVPCGGGGLISGVCQIVKKYKPETLVYGVEPYYAASVSAMIKENKAVKLEKIKTIAEGCAVKEAGEKIFHNYKDIVKDIIKIKDEELISSFIDVVEENKLIVEPSGLLTVSAVRYLDLKGKNVVCILSGGNLDIMQMSTMLVQGLKEKSRIFSFSVILNDKPGELLSVANIISDNNGNVVALDHNQFTNFTVNDEVELHVTVEAFGVDHKNQILEALKLKGYEIKEKQNIQESRNVNIN
ncbi:MAG: threonine ammonia-lyase [Lachnospirales bacterium]